MSPMADSTVRVVADDREEESGVPAALSERDNVSLAVDRLSVGDYYLVDDQLRVERKTPPAADPADGARPGRP